MVAARSGLHSSASDTERLVADGHKHTVYCLYRDCRCRAWLNTKRQPGPGGHAQPDPAQRQALWVLGYVFATGCHSRHQQFCIGVGYAFLATGAIATYGLFCGRSCPDGEAARGCWHSTSDLIRSGTKQRVKITDKIHTTFVFYERTRRKVRLILGPTGFAVLVRQCCQQC